MPLTITIGSTASAALAGGNLSLGPSAISGTLDPPVIQSVILQSGNNTVAVPSGAAGVWIEPPADGAVVLKYKTTSGDTGVDIPQNAPAFFAFDSNNVPASIYVNAGSLMTEYTQFVFV